MKISDLILSYPTGKGSRQRGLCRLRSFATSHGLVVLLTDLGNKNTGMSVTNAIEEVVGTAIQKGIVNGDSVFIEHYERDSFQRATFDLVRFSDEGKPDWKSISADQVLSLIGCEKTELDSPTLSNMRLLAEIDRIRQSIDPFADSPFVESPEIINRRADIVSGMLKKTQLLELVTAGAGEREIQRLLKDDLSIFGELYASPKDEYICFSEFPVADGVVDFALFTGRSRMSSSLK